MVTAPSGRVFGAATKVAVVTPLTVLRLPVPTTALLTLKVTVPVGSPAPGVAAATVAVKVTGWSTPEGFEDAVTVVVELAWFTVCDSVPELAVKPVLPL